MEKIILISKMGSDKTVCEAARVSFNIDDFNKITLTCKDESLLSYLAKNDHFTPFTHPQLTFRLTMPIFVARQWFKSQIGATINEVSRRYVIKEPEFYNPPVWRKAAINKKQGSLSMSIEQESQANKLYKELLSKATDTYKALLKLSVCPEQARITLPLSVYTEFIQTGSLYFFVRVCKLRLHEHAQTEIREYAKELKQILEMHFPVSCRYLFE